MPITTKQLWMKITKKRLKKIMSINKKSGKRNGTDSKWKNSPPQFFHREASHSEFVKMFLPEIYTVENCQRSTLGYPNLYRRVPFYNSLTCKTLIIWSIFLKLSEMFTIKSLLVQMKMLIKLWSESSPEQLSIY